MYVLIVAGQRMTDTDTIIKVTTLYARGLTE